VFYSISCSIFSSHISNVWCTD